MADLALLFRARLMALVLARFSADLVLGIETPPYAKLATLGFYHGFILNCKVAAV